MTSPPTPASSLTSYDSAYSTTDGGSSSNSNVKPSEDLTSESAISILNHLKQLGGLSFLPPFTSITKLKQGRIYTVQKIIKRVAGVDGAPYSGVQLYLDNCRTNIPSKYLLISFLFIFMR